jgi:hypothetical protein
MSPPVIDGRELCQQSAKCRFLAKHCQTGQANILNNLAENSMLGQLHWIPSHPDRACPLRIEPQPPQPCRSPIGLTVTELHCCSGLSLQHHSPAFCARRGLWIWQHFSPGTEVTLPL